MAALAAEVQEAPEASVPFSLKPILVDPEEGRYIVAILPGSLANLIAGRWPAGRSEPKGGGGIDGVGIGSGSGGILPKKALPMVAATGRSARVWVRYDAHLPSFSLWDGENSRSILTGVVLPTLHSHVLCKNLYMCGVCCEDCER